MDTRICVVTCLLIRRIRKKYIPLEYCEPQIRANDVMER